VASLALSGLPPSGVFAAEIAIIFGGIQAGWGPAAAAAAAILALAVGGLLFHMIRIGVGPAEQDSGFDPAPRRWAVVLAAPLVVVVVAGLWTPSPVSDGLGRVVEILGGGRG